MHSSGAEGIANQLPSCQEVYSAGEDSAEFSDHDETNMRNRLRGVYNNLYVPSIMLRANII
jgi:hypothetical protein